MRSMDVMIDVLGQVSKCILGIKSGAMQAQSMSELQFNALFFSCIVVNFEVANFLLKW